MLNMIASYFLVGLVVVLVSSPWLLPYSQLVLQVRTGCPKARREIAIEFLRHPTRTATLHLLLVAFTWHLELIVRIVHGLGATG